MAISKELKKWDFFIIYEKGKHTQFIILPVVCDEYIELIIENVQLFTYTQLFLSILQWNLQLIVLFFIVSWKQKNPEQILSPKIEFNVETHETFTNVKSQIIFL